MVEVGQPGERERPGSRRSAPKANVSRTPAAAAASPALPWARAAVVISHRAPEWVSWRVMSPAGASGLTVVTSAPAARAA